MKVSMIAACGENGEIGRGGKMPWPHLARDMKWFAKVTRGKPVIMGRRTWESLPGGESLPDRTNIVLSTSVRSFDASADAHAVPSLDAALAMASAEDAEEAFIIGGGLVYREALARGLVDMAYITKVAATYPDADTFFPYPLPAGEWEEKACHDRWFTDPASKLRLGFYTYTRKQSSPV